MLDNQAIYTAQEAAEYLRFSPTTLALWRSSGKGPAYIKISTTVRYRRVDLEEWINSDDGNRKRIESEAECHREKGRATRRARGRAGAEQRHRRLAAEPLCRDCKEGGVATPSLEIDHIVPLSSGGPDTDDNVRALCRLCHAERTRGNPSGESNNCTIALGGDQALVTAAQALSIGQCS